jgi:hypothetical protein
MSSNSSHPKTTTNVSLKIIRILVLGGIFLAFLLPALAYLPSSSDSTPQPSDSSSE